MEAMRFSRLGWPQKAQLHTLEQRARSGASPQQLDAALADEQTWVAGVWHSEVLVGYALVAQLPFEAELQAIGVLPSCQGQGIGQRLLNEVISVARRWQAERLLLEVRAGNTRAITVYLKAGFQKDGCRKAYYPATDKAAGREDALLMSLTL